MNIDESTKYNSDIITELFADLVEEIKQKSFDKDSVHSDIAEASGYYVERAIGTSKNLVFKEFMDTFNKELTKDYLAKFALSKEANEAARRSAVMLNELNYLREKSEEEKDRQKELIAPEDASKDENMDGMLDAIHINMDKENEEKERLRQELMYVE